MIFDLKKGLLSSEGSPFFVDLSGNFGSVYGTDFSTQLTSPPVQNNTLFLLPLSVQFRPLPNGSIWLDWAESEKGSEQWQERFTLSLLDRSFQAANEICRRTNDYELQLFSERPVDPLWVDHISVRMESAFSVGVIRKQ